MLRIVAIVCSLIELAVIIILSYDVITLSDENAELKKENERLENLVDDQAVFIHQLEVLKVPFEIE